MTTIENQTLEAFRLSNYQFIQANVSEILSRYLATKNIFSFSEFEENPIFDFTRYKDELVGATDFLGINLFGGICERIIMPNFDTSSFPQGVINLTNFVKLKEVSFNNGGAWVGFKGNMSHLTTLERVNIAHVTSSGFGLIIPPLANNPNLIHVNFIGNGFRTTDNISKFGNLQTCLALKYFKLTGLSSNADVKTLMDNILISLRAQKVAGGAIETIIISGNSAPTGGSSNPDYLWLIANGVSVTLGTL